LRKNVWWCCFCLTDIEHETRLWASQILVFLTGCGSIFFSVLVCPHAPLMTRPLPVALVQLRVLPPTSHHSPPREWTESLNENYRKCSCQFSWRRYKKDHCFTLGLPTEGRKAKVLFNFKISNSKRHCDKALDKVWTTLYSIPNSSKGKHCLIAFIECSQFRISSTYSKVRTTFYSIINSTTGKYCSVAFIWMVTL